MLLYMLYKGRFAICSLLGVIMGCPIPYINLYVYLFQVVFILCRNFLYV